MVRLVMLYNILKIIALMIILSKSFIVYGSQQSDLNETSPPNFQNIKNEMQVLFDEIIEINTALASQKVNQIPDFKELSNRKLSICMKLLIEYIYPFDNKMNEYIRDNPGVKSNAYGLYALRLYLGEEASDTAISIKNPDYIPNPLRCVNYGPYAKPDLGHREREIDKLNKELGGKVFLKRIDYINRSNEPFGRMSCDEFKEYKISKIMSPSSFQYIKNQMRWFFDEIIVINTALISGKINQKIKNEMQWGFSREIKNQTLDQKIESNTSLTLDDLKELSNRKVTIYNNIIKSCMPPHFDIRNIYIQANPSVRLDDNKSYALINHLKEEIINTEKFINNQDYVPDLPMVTMQVVPGKTTKQRIMEAQESIDNKIDEINHELGGKVLLKRSDYQKRRTRASVENSIAN